MSTCPVTTATSPPTIAPVAVPVLQGKGGWNLTPSSLAQKKWVNQGSRCGLGEATGIGWDSLPFPLLLPRQTLTPKFCLREPGSQAPGCCLDTGTPWQAALLLLLQLGPGLGPGVGVTGFGAEEEGSSEQGGYYCRPSVWGIWFLGSHFSKLHPTSPSEQQNFSSQAGSLSWYMLAGGVSLRSRTELGCPLTSPPTALRKC